ncbi:MAG TPA: deoxyribodipyrimidine photo-lyase [Verrucomicrobiae bacterium]|nr:deoxyribodipyrimidine photo-lyase [Verrucomicrobiae bacterium]
MTAPAPALLWLRNDLRLADNPALHAAIQDGRPVVPVFIWAPDEENPWAPGGASKWWLHQSLRALEAGLRSLGSRLILRAGASLTTLQSLVKETGAKAVFWNRRYEPAVSARDQKIKTAFKSSGLETDSFNAALLHEPWTILNQSRKPFQIFTPFWAHCLTRTDPPEPFPAPARLPVPVHWPESLSLEALALEPSHHWAAGFKSVWTPGEPGAQRQLQRFLREALGHYRDQRDRPDLPGTSRLSPHLHFGEIGPRQIWHGLASASGTTAGQPGEPTEATSLTRKRRRATVGGVSWREHQFLTEVGWREFAHHLLYHFPHTPAEPLREEFKKFPWHANEAFLQAWQKGRTGYPIVDAGMRELRTTGWMHNRVRMVVASFLVKDLLISWNEGAHWFWDALVDADLAGNTLGWQWTAGCGADAAPYFRVFNPISQGEKFDPNGTYVRRWCPELARMPDNWVHHPWEAPPDVLQEAGVELGRTYPEPILSHAIAREVALEAFSQMKRA